MTPTLSFLARSRSAATLLNNSDARECDPPRHATGLSVHEHVRTSVSRPTPSKLVLYLFTHPYVWCESLRRSQPVWCGAPY